MDEPPRQGLFEKGYDDKILMHEGQLDNWKAYLDDNPRHLLLKLQHPQFFTVLSGMEVAGRSLVYMVLIKASACKKTLKAFIKRLAEC